MNIREFMRDLIERTNTDQVLWNEEPVYWGCRYENIFILIDPYCIIIDSRGGSSLRLLWWELSINGAPVKDGWWQILCIRRAIKKHKKREKSRESERRLREARFILE